MDGRGKALRKVRLHFGKTHVKYMTVGRVFGEKPISPPQMIKKLWQFIKEFEVRVK